MTKSALDLTILKRFVRSELPPHRVSIFYAIGFMIMAAAATTASAWILQYVIDDLFVSARGELLWPIAFGIVSVYVLKGIATFGYSTILARVSARLASTMRKRSIARLLAQDIPFHDSNETADLVNRISTVTKSAGQLVSLLTTSAMRDFLTVIFLLIFMLYKDWLLTILTFLIAPPVVGGITLISRRIRNSVSSEFSSTSQFMQQLVERLSGIRIVKSARAEAESEALLSKTVDSLEKRAIKIAKITAFSSPLMEALGGVAVAAMIVYAGYSVIHGQSSAGEIMAFILAFISAYEPIKRLAGLRVNLVSYIVPLGYYYELADRVSPQKFGTKNLPDIAPEIIFSDVSFAYSAGHGAALSHVSFSAPKGKITALVGRSGSGKSTIFSLLQRFYDPQSGQISIGGVPSQELTEEALRRAIAYISQDAVIFTGTVAENIALGQQNISREAISIAASQAFLDDVISNLPQGLDTMIGEGHMGLSGGQKQRLSIARAILKNAPILLLDEATSALDSEAEAVIQNALKTATRGKTVLVIAHRLSTIRDADQILVLDKGQIAEVGDHNGLLARDGIYAMLSKLQFTLPS